MENRVFLGRYQAVRLLGEGGTSRVYLARPLGGGREVVVKVLHERRAANPRFRDCFQREMLLLKRFQHPGAVALLDASATDPQGPCIVMEYIQGIDLDALLKRHGKLTPLRAGRLLVQICRVLQAAHNQGIVHRDLKPANLMVVHPDTAVEKVKVMDFGLSRLDTELYIPLEELNHAPAEHAAGTPEYISPEEVLRQPVDHRCDIYSLGVILYQLLTGKLPFTGNMDQLLKAHAEQPPPTLAAAGVEVPPGVEAVVMTCMAKHREERPQSARDLAELYERVLRQKLIREPIDAPAAPAPAAAPPPPTIAEGPVAKKAADPNTVVKHLEAFMPMQIAAMKLRGFVEGAGGEAIESVPGKIRVRLYERREVPQEPGPGLLSRMGLARKGTTVAVANATEMELYMEKKGSSPQSLLHLTVMLRPEGGRAQAADPAWGEFCDRIFRELRAYLMTNG